MDLDKRKNRFGKYACACCGNFTISQIHDSCPVCSWEEDYYQETHPLDSGGPNRVSLIEAKENYVKFGVSNIELAELVREPTLEERTSD